MGLWMGVAYCLRAAWMNWVLWGETANQVLSPPFKLTPLSVENPHKANLQGEWQGLQSFPLRQKNGKRSCNQGRGGGEKLWIKKEREIQECGKEGGIKKKDWLKNMTNKKLMGKETQSKLIPDILKKIAQRDFTFNETNPLKCCQGYLSYQARWPPANSNST